MVSAHFALSATVAALVSSVAADLKVLAPGGPNLWWVGNSVNTIAWTCHESPYGNFTIQVANTNQNVLVQPQAIVAIENNFDCSKTITQQQEIFPAGTGYSIQLVNPLDPRQVYAESDQFEIKPEGSAYPDPSSTPTESVASSTGSSSGASQTSGGNSGAAAQTSAPAKNGASAVSGSIASTVAVAAGMLGLMFA